MFVVIAMHENCCNTMNERGAFKVLLSGVMRRGTNSYNSTGSKLANRNS